MKITAKRTIQLPAVRCNRLSATAQAAATDIANSPMASSGNTSIKPNIMFILDDSGSMDWEYLPDSVDNNNDRFMLPNYLYNGVYYNPNTTILCRSCDGFLLSNSRLHCRLGQRIQRQSTKNPVHAVQNGNDGVDKAAYYYNLHRHIARHTGARHLLCR